MKRLPLLYLFTLVLFDSFTCSKENSEKDCGPLGFHSVDFNDLDCKILIDSSISGDVDLVISSLEELYAHVQFPENGNPQCQKLIDQIKAIDFDMHVLLIGKRKITGLPGVLNDQNIIKDCLTNQVSYNVSYKSGQYTAMGYFYFGAIIPRQDGKKNIVFNISLIKPT